MAGGEKTAWSCPHPRLSKLSAELSCAAVGAAVTNRYGGKRRDSGIVAQLSGGQAETLGAKPEKEHTMGAGAVSGSSGSQNMCVAPEDASDKKSLEQKESDIENNGIHDLIEKGCQEDLKLPDSMCDYLGDVVQNFIDNIEPISVPEVPPSLQWNLESS